MRAVGLAAQRGERPLFRGLDFELPPGCIVWLRGRNGRGKTSLLRVLAGLAEPSQGRVVVEAAAGAVPGSRIEPLYLAHANALKDDLTVTESLRFLCALHSQPASDVELSRALERLGIAAQRNALVRTLSQGQRRRAALSRLALALGAAQAAIWLLDEPFDALDVDGVLALQELLSAHAARGGSALLTSHQVPALHDPEPRVLDLDGFAVRSGRSALA